MASGRRMQQELLLLAWLAAEKQTGDSQHPLFPGAERGQLIQRGRNQSLLRPPQSCQASRERLAPQGWGSCQTAMLTVTEKESHPTGTGAVTHLLTPWELHSVI